MSEFWQRFCKWKDIQILRLFYRCHSGLCNLSEYLPWCFSNVRDALICRAGVFINNICVKYFRAFAVVAEVVRNFFAGVGWFDINVVFLNNGSYSFLESYWTTAYVNCCEIGVVFGFCFLFIFCVNTFILFKCWIVDFVSFLEICWFWTL